MCMRRRVRSARPLWRWSRSFNTRAEQPTHWRLHLHEGPQLLQRLVADGYGDFVVLAGRNNTKLATMASLTQAGLHVLADKPWLTDSRQLPYLTQVTAGPRARHGPDDGAAQSPSPADRVGGPHARLFGTFVTQEGAAPAIDIASVHHLDKRVNGRPLQRPAWYYDYDRQGDGIVDVNLIWWSRRSGGCSVKPRASMSGISCSRVSGAGRARALGPVSREHRAGHVSGGAATLRPCRRAAVRLQQRDRLSTPRRPRAPTAEWRQREPEGAGDLHRLTIRGSRCDVGLRPGCGDRHHPTFRPSDGWGGAGTHTGSWHSPQWQARSGSRGPFAGRGPLPASVRARSRASKSFCPGPPCSFWITLTVVSGQRHCARVCVCAYTLLTHALATWRSGRTAAARGPTHGPHPFI